MDDFIGEVIDGAINPGVDDAIIDLASLEKPNKSNTVRTVWILFVMCIALLPITIALHVVEADRSRFSRLTFYETANGLQAEILVERQVAEIGNLLNIPDQVSGPMPALKIQEYEADDSDPPMRAVSYRVVESAAGLPLRARAISAEEPHGDSGIRDLIRLIPDDRVNAYLSAGADELELHGHYKLAQATRTGSTQVISTEHNLFGTRYALWSWILGGIAMMLFPFLIRESMRRNAI
tara:strand:- start:131 stop:841 length:711 start_codon:yes stop_codon:yes gene_type:complete